MSESETTPVIDLFAGPGGLGEGFSAYEENGERRFRVRLSVEKDHYAHQTLRLRSFFRQFEKSEVPQVYYDLLSQTFPLEAFPDHLKADSRALQAWECANRESMHAELGPEDTHTEISKRIKSVIGNKKRPWVLLGGPPCQAYSIVGRVRNLGNKDYRIEDDHRSGLYQEYLRIIAEHRPTIFVMENVKGMLSATVQNQKIFEKILNDLTFPVPEEKDFYYRIQSIVVKSKTRFDHDPRDFIVECEKYGVPQKRHRVIVVGIREGSGIENLPLLTPSEPPTVKTAIGDLPKIRSGLSRRRVAGKYEKLKDSPSTWIESIQNQVGLNGAKHLPDWLNQEDAILRDRIVRVAGKLSKPKKDKGGEFIQISKSKIASSTLHNWYYDERLEGICNHVSRLHMESDLTRYLYAACYGDEYGTTPKLRDYPEAILPEHKNAKTGDFDDRFRVQVANAPSTTITSHIAKDGHYFIHYDPSQCRSLTVREAARLQTFPDNYYFCGPRSAQYVQVGNAVPPWIARQIAECVWKSLVDAGAA